MNIKAAIFDLDGTLVDSLFLWDVLWANLGEKYLGDKTFRPDSEVDKKVRTLTLKDAMELIHKTYSFGVNGDELLDFSNSLMIDFYKNEVKLKDGVREFLQYLKAKGVKMCIASASAKDIIEYAVKHCEIEDCICGIFSCAEFGKGKEEPDIYLYALDFLGESTEDTWVFEDSLVAIKTATKIGMPTVGIFDRYNFGFEEMQQIATISVAENETFLKLL